MTDDAVIAALRQCAAEAEAAANPHLAQAMGTGAQHLEAAVERADYAWRNTRTIEAARQTEMQARTVCENRCRRLEILLRDFLSLDDWHDDAIAPAELIERARAEVGHKNATDF